MGKFVITGGNRLADEIITSGAKNAAITIIPAAIMADDICRIENIPNITDVTAIVQILYDVGVKIRKTNSSIIEINPRPIHTCVASCELARRIHGSHHLLGVLLGRFRHAVVSIPGGCNFGACPIDQHLKGFGALGAAYALEGGMVDVSARELIGNNTYIDAVSVGATVNTMLTAVQVKGTTVIENAAKESHIVDLTNFLNSIRVDIHSADTDVIKIYGVEHLKGTVYSITPDQIEAGTYMATAAATGGDVLIKNVILEHLESISAKLEGMGVTVKEYDNSIRIKHNQPLSYCSIKTISHPGLPTDMQPQIAVVPPITYGTSVINENAWGNRFRYMEGLKRMGAQISVDSEPAVAEGVDHPNITPARTTDPRADAAMLIVALCAHGASQIEDIQHIERGYKDVEKKLLALGTDIKRTHVLDPSMAQAV